MSKKPDPGNAGPLRGYYLGSGDRTVAIERQRRLVARAEEHLSTESIDQIALRIVMYLNVEAGDEGARWLLQWNAEVAEDKHEHGQARIQ